MATNLQNLFLATLKSFNPSTLKSFDTASGVVETDLAKSIQPTLVTTYSDKIGADATTRGVIIGPFGSPNGALLPNTASNYSGIILDSTDTYAATELADFNLHNISFAVWFANKTDQNYPKVILATSTGFAITLKDQNTLTFTATQIGRPTPIIDLTFDGVTFKKDEWNLLVVVCNRTTGKIRIFVNGVLSDKNIQSSSAIQYSPPTNVPIKKVALGAYPGLASENWPSETQQSHSGFTGMRTIAFASGAVWHRTALTDEQVDAITKLGANSNLVITASGTQPGTLDANITVDGAITKTIDGNAINLSAPVAITDITAGTGISLDRTGTVVEISAVSILPEGIIKSNTSDTAPDYLINKISVDSGLAIGITPAAVGPTANVFYAVNYTSLQAITEDVNDGDMAVVSTAITNTSDATVYARIDSQWIEQNYPTGSSVIGKLKYLSSSNWPPANQPAAADYEYGAIALVSAEADLPTYLDGDKNGKLYVLINANAWNSTSGWREIIPPSASFVKLAIDYPALIEKIAKSETFVNTATKTKTVFNDKTSGFLKEKLADGSNTNVTTEEITITSNARYSYNLFPPLPAASGDEVNYWLYGNILIVSPSFATAAAFTAAATEPLTADLYILAHQPANQTNGTIASDWIKLTPDTGNKVCFATSVAELPTAEVPAGCFAVVAADLNNTQANIYQENSGNWQLYRDGTINKSTVAKINLDSTNIINIVTTDPTIVRTANSLPDEDLTADKVRVGKDTTRLADKYLSLRTINRVFRPANQAAMLALASGINDMVVSGDIAILGDESGIYIFNGILSDSNWQSSGYRRPYACNEATVMYDWEKLIDDEILNLPAVVADVEVIANKAIDERNYVTPEQFGAAYDAVTVGAYEAAMVAQNAAQLAYNTAVSARSSTLAAKNAAIAAHFNIQREYDAKIAYDAAVITQSDAQDDYDDAVLGGDVPTIEAALIALNAAIADTALKSNLLEDAIAINELYFPAAINGGVYTAATLITIAAAAADEADKIAAYDDAYAAVPPLQTALNVAKANTTTTAAALAELNTDPWNEAIATGKRILCKKEATYYVTTLEFDQADQIIDLNGCTLKLIDSTGIYITGTNCCICNGTIDGQKTAACSSDVSIKIDADRTKIRDACIKNGGGLAIDVISGNNISIENNLFLNNYLAAVLCHQSGDIENISIVNNVCDTTEIGAAHTLGAFMIHQQDNPYYFDGVLISGNTIRRQINTGVTANMVGIEVYGNCKNARVTENLIIGGSIGITIAVGAQAVVDSNSCKFQTLIGIELARSNNSIVSNNICQGIDGGTSDNAITCTACNSPRAFWSAPDWNVGTTYNTDDRVLYAPPAGDNKLWQALASSTGVTPGTDPTKWVLTGATDGAPNRRPLYDAFGNIIAGIITRTIFLLKHPDWTIGTPIAMPSRPNFDPLFVSPAIEDIIELDPAVPGNSIIIKNSDPANDYIINYNFALPGGTYYEVFSLTDTPPYPLDENYGITAGPDTCAMPWDKLTCTIIGNTISNYQRGVHLQNNTHSKVVNNKMSGISERGVRCTVGTEYTSIIGNTFEGIVVGTNPQFVILEASTAVQINNNIVDGCYNFLRYYSPTAYTVENVMITGNTVINKDGADILNVSPSGVLTLPTPNKILVKNNIGLTNIFVDEAGSAQLSAPPTTGWTQYNGATTIAFDTTYGANDGVLAVNLAGTGTVNTDKLVAQMQNLPGSTWTLTIKLPIPYNGFGYYGFGVTDGTKFTQYCLTPTAGQMKIYRYATSSSTKVEQASLSNAVSPATDYPLWFRLSKGATNTVLSQSKDGVRWTVLDTEANVDSYITAPTKIGLIGNTYTDGVIDFTCTSFSLTIP